MAITINGSGTVTGITSGGLPDGVITTDDLAANAVTTAKLGTNEASGLCKAWVNFNGTGTVAIRDSYNVSSITDDGTGVYTVNLATALEDVNYAVSANCSRGGGATNLVTETNRTNANTSSSVAVAFRDSGFALQDMDYVYVAIFR
jgi:hypothetical protein